MAESFRFRDEWLVRTVLASRGTSAAVDQARAEKRPWLADALVSMKALAVPELGELVHKTHGFPFAELGPDACDKGALALLPDRLCRRCVLLAFRATAETLDLAMACPLDHQSQEDAAAVSGRKIIAFYALPARLEAVIAKVFDPDAVVFDLIERLDPRACVELMRGAPAPAASGSADVRMPVIRLVDALIARAVALRASDIHIEHEERSSLVRYRVDGNLRNVMHLPRYLATGPVVSRFKIMCDLDVAEHFRPQDGRAKVRVAGVEIGLRVSILPTQMGQKVVARILDERHAHRSFAGMGVDPGVAARLDGLLRLEKGMILVTGPTGSGKTTTLYAALNKLRGEGINIVTVEDPIEYRLSGVNQVQVNERQGLHFSTVLRSVLRQDPDVIMVGEIRDRETAEVAVQAAMTGHLLLSTLHTNDATAAVTRLQDIGVERYKLASALIGVTAQRLVRRLCQECRAPDPAALPPALGLAMSRAGLPSRAFISRGCPACSFTGFTGRTAVLELLEMNDSLRDAVGRGCTAQELRDIGMSARVLHTLAGDAVRLLAEGASSAGELAAYIEETREMPPRPLPNSAGVSPAQGARSPAAREATVLITDPDPERRDSLRKAIAGFGFGVLEASDERATASAAATGKLAAVVVHRDLADAEGANVIALLRSGLGFVDLPIIVLGADPETARGLGATDGRSEEDSQGVAARLAALLRRPADWPEAGELASPRLPVEEHERLEALTRTGLLDTPPEERFDRIARMAQRALAVPVALVTLIDRDRQWFKSHQGVELTQTPREVSFCAHAILGEKTLVIEDAALDPRFAQNPMVQGPPGVRFYAGTSITTSDGRRIGTLCVVDVRPRRFTDADVRVLQELADLVKEEILRGPTAAGPGSDAASPSAATP